MKKRKIEEYMEVVNEIIDKEIVDDVEKERISEIVEKIISAESGYIDTDSRNKLYEYIKGLLNYQRR